MLYFLSSQKMRKIKLHKYTSVSLPFYSTANIQYGKTARWIMMTSSNGNISTLLALCEGNPSVTSEFPAQRTVVRIFDVFFDLRLNKRLCKQSWRRWLKTPWRSLWRHSNVILQHTSKYIRNSFTKLHGTPDKFPLLPKGELCISFKHFVWKVIGDDDNRFHQYQ